MSKIKVKLEVQYNGHSIKKNGDVDLQFKAPYSEIANALTLVSMINANITVKAKVGNDKPISLGSFYLKNINIDRDGETKIRLNTELESSEINNFNELTQPETIIYLSCSADIENEEDEEGEDDE